MTKEKEKQFEKEINSTEHHQLSHCIQLEYLHLYNPATLLNARNEKGDELFVVRMVVKVGHPA